ncbi:MAG: transposase [Chloroflexi bacterium]|nr:transposase [Chloroflexota bacterium]
MAIEDFIIALYCRVDDVLGRLPKDPQALLYPSEVVTLAMLFALKGLGNRKFYRWLSWNWRHLFPHLPERTRLFRLFENHRTLADRFLADPSLLCVVDSFGVELLHPYREGRSLPQIGRKGLSNHRWIIGAKLCVILNNLGLAVSWECQEGSAPDQNFQPFIAGFADETVVLSDQGFHASVGDPANLWVHRRGQWNDRMVVETVFSMLTATFQAKRLWHRTWDGVAYHIAYMLAAFNLLVQWHGFTPDQSGFVRLSLTEFCL